MRNETKKLHNQEDLLSNDWYRILGVRHDATSKEITTAYRRLARKYHPDTNPDYDATSKFTLINEAYQIIGDEQSRSMYDWERGLISKMDVYRFYIVKEKTNLIDYIDQELDGNIKDESAVFVDLWTTTKSTFIKNGKWEDLKKKINIIGIAELSQKDWEEGTNISLPIERYTICELCKGKSSLGDPNDPLNCYYCEGTGLETEKIFVKIKIPPMVPMNKILKVPGRGHRTPIKLGDLLVKVQCKAKLGFWSSVSSKLMNNKK